MALAGCNVVLGLGDFSNCPQDGPCPTGNTGGAGTGGGTGGNPTCTDGKRNGDETGVDCGGGTCEACPAGQGCVVGTDCASLVCKGGTCVAAKCDDEVKNGEETDADCGGPTCGKCTDGATCKGAMDCASAVCDEGKCVPAACADGVKNGSETATDCGGGVCAGCAPGMACGVAADCESAICKANACVDYRVWGRQFGNNESQGGNRVTTSTLADAFVLGSFLGTVDLGGGPLTTCDFDPQDPPSCLGDYFVARLKQDGTYAWATHLINQSDAYGGPVGFNFTTDSSGNVYIVGSGNGKIDIGGGLLSPPATCNFDCNGTVIGKLDSTGTHKWSKRFDGSSGGEVAGLDIAVSSSGATVTTGILAGTVNFGGTALTSNGQDAFVASFDSSGAHLWSKRYGDASSSEQCGESVAIDAAGNVLVAGIFKSSITFGGPTLTSTGGFDIFVTKLNVSGGHVWSKRFGDVQDQAYSCSGGNDLTVTTDAAGNVILAGRLKGTIDFGGGALTGNGADGFIAKYDPAGGHLWSKQLGTVVPGRPATDGANAVLLTGRSTGVIDFGDASLPGSEGFVVKLASDGSHLWSRRLGGVRGSSIAASSAGYLLLTGALVTTEDFGGTPLVSAGGTDAFVAKMVNP
ncbi:Flagellar hook-length control protein FliK [Minicystis rosea]|nr:Flagellar hook-length control protein FliK [Minicystis rosea]